MVKYVATPFCDNYWLAPMSPLDGLCLPIDSASSTELWPVDPIWRRHSDDTMKTANQRSSMSTPDALLVVRRFARNVVATRRLRRELRSCRSLARVFAGDAISPAECHSHIHQYLHTLPVVTGIQGPSSARIDKHPDCHARAQRHSDGNESSSSSGFSQPATLETVVHDLFIRLEAATRACHEKDERIRTLEAQLNALSVGNAIPVKREANVML